MLLPIVKTLDEYRRIYRDEAVWLPAMQAICARHELDPTSLSIAPPGSNVVFWGGPGLVIKLFAPMWQADAAKEARCLDALSTQPHVHTPRICARGAVEGWPYLVLSRVPGTALDELWDGLSFDGRLRIAESLGRCLAFLHRVDFSGLDQGRAEWQAYHQSHLGSCVAAQAQKGLARDWLEDLTRWIAQLDTFPLRQPELVLVNGDLNPEHLFCEEGPEGWTVTGMIDFGDARIAHPFYDFVRPGKLLQVSPRLRKAMLHAYGFPENAFTPALTRELFFYDLIHEFANIPEHLGELKDNPPASLQELIEMEWGF